MKLTVHGQRISLLGCVIAAFGLSGCSTLASIDSSAELADAAAGKPVAFGRFELVRNGRTVDLGDGPFASHAVLHLTQVDGVQSVKAHVGEGGEFAWALEPGRYQLDAIAFDARGERRTAATNSTFVVGEGQKAVYLGTLTLTTTVESGYYGLNGTIDDFVVTDDCARDCKSRLDKLGVSSDDMARALVSEPVQIAGTDARTN